MKPIISFLLIFPVILLFPACMMTQMGSSGMHRTQDANNAHDHQKLHLMDENFHVDIYVFYSEPLLYTFTITKAATGDPARNINGALTVLNTNISSELKADIPEKGQYTTVIRAPADSKNDISMFLTIGDDMGIQSTYGFSLGQVKHSEYQQGNQQSLNIATTPVLVGAGMGLMMIGMMLFRWF